MHLPFGIVICIVIILEMIVETNAKLRVHSEYTRRQWALSQKRAFNLFDDIPHGVHYGYYKRRRQMINSRPAPVVKIRNVIPATKYRHKSTTPKIYFNNN